MILTILVPYDRPSPHVAGLCASIAMLCEGSEHRLVAVQYGDQSLHTVTRAYMEQLDRYLRDLGWSVRTEATCLSEVWNLGAMLARVNGEMGATPEVEGPGDCDWGLIVVDPHVRLAPEAIPQLAEGLESSALVWDAQDGPTFDGMLFGFAHPDAGILLTSTEHDDPKTCALDLLASLDVEADTLAVNTGSPRIP